MEQTQQISLAIATIIRDRSKARQLVRFEEIIEELHKQGFLESEIGDQESHFDRLIGEALKENGDLQEISGSNAKHYYYSEESLTETYAGLLVGKEEGPLQLIAQTVRENSATYPRPVPVDIFEQSPFDFTQAEILLALEKMGQQEEYQDIVRTTTSIGTTFLFSNRHLQPDYASTLAEWLDVGQMNNP